MALGNCINCLYGSVDPVYIYIYIYMDYEDPKANTTNKTILYYYYFFEKHKQHYIKLFNFL